MMPRFCLSRYFRFPLSKSRRLTLVVMLAISALTLIQSSLIYANSDLWIPSAEASVGAPTGFRNVCSICLYTNIQTALDAAGTGDIIRVAAGVYTENLVLMKSVTLIGGYTDIPNFTQRNLGTSIIDGALLGRAIIITGEIAPLIDGFTFQHGNAALSSVQRGYGAGVLIYAAAATVQNNKIVNNSSSITNAFGGGIAVISSSATISNNVIAGNSVTATDNIFSGGGGVYVNNGSPALISNTIAANLAFGNGAGIYILNRTKPQSPTIQFNVLYDNQSIGINLANGGGLLISAVGGFPIVDANRFYSNTSDNGVLGIDTVGRFQVTNNLLKFNSNGGIYVYSAQNGVIAHNVVLDNYGTYGGIRLGVPGSSTYVFNNIIQGNQYGLELEKGVIGQWDYNLIRNNAAGNIISTTLGPNGTIVSVAASPHDLNADPVFNNPTEDYHLQDSSPAINRGGLLSIAGRPYYDADGNPRPFTPNSKACDAPDIGMYERNEAIFQVSCSRVFLPVIARQR